MLALVLPFVAGAVNASGFFIVGVYTSHVTGSVARIGDEIAQGNFRLAGSFALLVLTFFAGAVTATFLVEKANRRHRARYTAALTVEAIALVAVTVVGIVTSRDFSLLHVVASSLLSFAMGAQNALVTKVSGAVVRTTHLTGIVTDMGIEVVRLAAWFQRQTRGHSAFQRALELWRVRGHAELKRLRLHAAIFGSFMTGAIGGPVLYLHTGYASMLFPVAVLVALAAFDSTFGLRPHERTAPAELPAPVPAPTPASSFLAGGRRAR